MADNRQYKLTKEQIEDARSLFNLFDKDNNGRLTKSEVEAAIRSRNENLSDDQISLTMRLLDFGANGYITFDEFLKMGCDMNELCEFDEELSEVQLKQLFRAFDIDGNGILSIDEVTKIMSMATAGCAKQPSDQEMEEMMKEIDINGDWQIDYNEFAKAMLSQ